MYGKIDYWSNDNLFLKILVQIKFFNNNTECSTLFEFLYE